MKRRAFILWMFFGLFLGGMIPGISAPDTEKKETCAICHMKIDKRTHFIGKEVAKDVAKNNVGKNIEKPVHFCSFICALQYRKKSPQGELKVRDYTTGKELNADTAHFLINSMNIADELGFGMPPMVVAFESKKGADEVLKRLKDGNLVKGFQDVQKNYQ